MGGIPFEATAAIDTKRVLDDRWNKEKRRVPTLMVAGWPTHRSTKWQRMKHFQ